MCDGRDGEEAGGIFIFVFLIEIPQLAGQNKVLVGNWIQNFGSCVHGSSSVGWVEKQNCQLVRAACVSHTLWRSQV